MKPGAVHRFSGIYLTAEKNPERPFDQAYATRHCLKWGPLPPNNVGRIAQ